MDCSHIAAGDTPPVRRATILILVAHSSKEWLPLQNKFQMYADQAFSLIIIRKRIEPIMRRMNGKPHMTARCADELDNRFAPHSDKRT